MAWYEDKTRKTYVATYSSERLMRSEVEAAARFGFVTQDVAPHKQGWTVTYYRDERRWARIQVEQALKQISLERDKLRQMESKIVGLRGDLQARFQAARKEASSPTKLESALLKAISDLISDRRAANTQRQTVLATYRTLDTARAEAAALKEEILQANLIDIDKESAPLRRKFAEEEQQLQQEEALRQAQQAVLKAVQAWQNAIGDRWGLHGKVEGADKKLTSTSTLLTAADARESGKIATKVRAAEAELAKHQTKLETIETVLQQRENDLLRELEARDTCMAALSFVS